MPDLEFLRFGADEVSDEGMQVIATFPSLRILHLIHVPITDASVDAVINMKKLESLYVDGSQLSDEGIVRLLKARPDLHFHRDQRHHDLDPSKESHSH